LTAEFEICKQLDPLTCLPGSARAVLAIHVERFERFFVDQSVFANALMNPVNTDDPFATSDSVQKFQSALSAIFLI
jgi:hypothetical protein